MILYLELSLLVTGQFNPATVIHNVYGREDCKYTRIFCVLCLIVGLTMAIDTWCEFEDYSSSSSGSGELPIVKG